MSGLDRDHFFDDLGDKLILDDIEVDINLIAEPA